MIITGFNRCSMTIIRTNFAGKRPTQDDLSVFGFDSSEDDCVPGAAGVDDKNLDVIGQNSFPSPNYEGNLDHVVNGYGCDPYLSPRSEEAMDVSDMRVPTTRHTPSIRSDEQDDNVLGMPAVSFNDLLDGSYGMPSIANSEDPTDEIALDEEIQKYLELEAENPIDNAFVDELLEPEIDVENVVAEKKPNVQFTSLNAEESTPVPKTRGTLIVRGGTRLPSPKDCKETNVIIVRPTTAVRPTAKPAEVKKMPVREAKQRTPRMYSPVPSVGSCTSSTDNYYEEKGNRSAIQARLNRQKKKAYISGLEKQVAELSKENKQLHSSTSKMRKNLDSLEQELSYLQNVLHNDSVLADMLGNLSSGLNVSLTTSFKNDRKRSASDMDHDYGRPSKQQKTETKKAMSGGVCLHVDKRNVSLEFCSKCARMAKESEP